MNQPPNNKIRVIRIHAIKSRIRSRNPLIRLQYAKSREGIRSRVGSRFGDWDVQSWKQVVQAIAEAIARRPECAVLDRVFGCRMRYEALEAGREDETLDSEIRTGDDRCYGGEDAGCDCEWT